MSKQFFEAATLFSRRPEINISLGVLSLYMTFPQSEKCVYVLCLMCVCHGFLLIYSYCESAVVVLPCWLCLTADLLQYSRQLRMLQSSPHVSSHQQFVPYYFFFLCFALVCLSSLLLTTTMVFDFQRNWTKYETSSC